MPHIALFLYWPLMFYKNGFELESCPKMSLLKWDMSKPPQMFIAIEIMYKSRQYQISRSWFVYHFNLLTSDTQFCFSYTWAPWCHTEKWWCSFFGHTLNCLLFMSIKIDIFFKRHFPFVFLPLTIKFFGP